jgi:hypothetical protein
VTAMSPSYMVCSIVTIRRRRCAARLFRLSMQRTKYVHAWTTQPRFRETHGRDAARGNIIRELSPAPFPIAGQRQSFPPRGSNPVNLLQMARSIVRCRLLTGPKERPLLLENPRHIPKRAGRLKVPTRVNHSDLHL